MSRPTSPLRDIEVVEDRTARSTCTDGFLRLRRLVLRNRYADGSASRDYACDIVSRRHVDAVAIVLYERNGPEVQVALRTGVRPPVTFRREKDLPHPDPAPLLLGEIVAGVLEAEDRADGGIERRAAVECHEEAGYRIDPAEVTRLGAPLYPTPGVTDERVHFRAAAVPLESRGEPASDGSVMEEAGEVIVLPLREAIRRCRSGDLPDMKTEIGLLRLADAIGYLPALDRFVEDLPGPERGRAEDLPSLLGDD